MIIKILTELFFELFFLLKTTKFHSGEMLNGVHGLFFIVSYGDRSKKVGGCRTV